MCFSTVLFHVLYLIYSDFFSTLCPQDHFLRMPALDSILTPSASGQIRGEVSGFACCVGRSHKVAESSLPKHPKACWWQGTSPGAILPTSHKGHEPPTSSDALHKRHGAGLLVEPQQLCFHVSALRFCTVCQFIKLVQGFPKKWKVLLSQFIWMAPALVVCGSVLNKVRMRMWVLPKRQE